jgi:hypothetical protein
MSSVDKEGRVTRVLKRSKYTWKDRSGLERDVMEVQVETLEGEIFIADSYNQLREGYNVRLKERARRNGNKYWVATKE